MRIFCLLVIASTLVNLSNGCKEKKKTSGEEESTSRKGVDVASIKYLGMIPGDSDYIGYFNMKDVIGLAKAIMTKEMLTQIDMSSLDDFIQIVKKETGIDLDQLEDVTVAGKIGGESHLVLLAEAKAFADAKLELVEEYEGQKIQKIAHKGYKRIAIAIIQDVAVVADSVNDIRWAVAGVKDKSKSFKANQTAIDALKEVGKSLRYGTARFYMTLAGIPDEDFRALKIKVAAFSIDLDKGMDGIMLADASTAEKIDAQLNEGLKKMKKEWGDLLQSIAKEKEMLSSAGISDADLKEFDSIIQGLKITRDGGTFRADQKLTSSTAKLIAKMFLVLFASPGEKISPEHQPPSTIEKSSDVDPSHVDEKPVEVTTPPPPDQEP